MTPYLNNRDQQWDPRDLVSLDAWRRPRRSLLAKTLATLITLTFLLPYVAFAFDAATYPTDLLSEFGYKPLKVNGRSLTIKPEWGRVTSSYQGASGRTIVYIQDLHCNYEVQSNIQAMLNNFMNRNQLQLVGVEGESTPVNVSKLSTIPLEPVKEKVGQYFLQRGRITGAEYQAATSPKPLNLHGIENQGLYDANRNSLLSFLNEESQGYCQDLRYALERLKRPLYNTALAKMDHERESYDQENITLEKYCDFLLSEAQRQGVELAPYKVLRLYSLEHRLPANAAVDYERLLREAEALDRAIRRKLYSSSEQRQLDYNLYILKITENLVNISATEEDLGYFRAHREAFSVVRMLRFLEDISYRFAIQPDLDPGVLKLDGFVEQASEFYRVADKRSHAFVENITAAMKKRRQDLAVLITGGFHASHVETALRQQDISFVTIKPRITRTDVANPYFSLLRNERTPLEKLLARNENIFAPRSLFNNGVFQRYMETVWEIELGRKLVLEDKLEGEALQEAFRAARGNYAADDNNISLAFQPDQSNPENGTYVFQFEKEADWFVVVRPNQTANYSVNLEGEVLHGNNFMFQFVSREEFAEKRAQILGSEEPGRAGVFALSDLAARIADVTNPITRAIGALAIAIGAPQGLRGLTSSEVGSVLASPFVRVARAVANLWSTVVARVGGWFQPQRQLIARAMQWSLDQYGYAGNAISRTDIEIDLQNVLNLAQGNPVLRDFIANQANRLALAGMAYTNGRSPFMGEITPTQNVETLARDFMEAEDLANQILDGRDLARLDLQNAGSHLAQLVQAVRNGETTFIKGEQDIFSPERALPEYTSARQLEAMRTLAEQNRVKVQIPEFAYNPVIYFRPAKLQVSRGKRSLTDLAERLNADVLQEALPLAAIGTEEKAVEGPVADETTVADAVREEEVTEIPRIDLTTSRRTNTDEDLGLVGPAGAGAETLTLQQILARATPLSRLNNQQTRDSVTTAFQQLGFTPQADGRVLLKTSAMLRQVRQVRQGLVQEQRRLTRRKNFLSRQSNITPARQEELLTVNRTLSQFDNAVFELDEIAATFRENGDRVFEVRLSDEMNALEHGHAFSQVSGEVIVLDSRALDRASSRGNRLQLLRRIAHESGHIAGLDQTRIGEIRAGLIAKILSGVQMGIADITAETGSVNRRAILGETVNLPLAAVGPASEITLSEAQRETMNSWFNRRGWTEVALPTQKVYMEALDEKTLSGLVPRTSRTDPTYLAGVRLLEQITQALTRAENGVYSGADVMFTFKYVLKGLTLDAAVQKLLEERQEYVGKTVADGFKDYERARGPVTSAEQVQDMINTAFLDDEGMAIVPVWQEYAQRAIAQEKAAWATGDRAVELYLNFNTQSDQLFADLPVALRAEAEAGLRAELEQTLSQDQGLMSVLVAKKLSTLIDSQQAAITAMRNFNRLLQDNFNAAVFAGEENTIRTGLRRRGQELLRQAAAQQAAGVFSNKAPPTEEILATFLPKGSPVTFIYLKLTADPRFTENYANYTVQTAINLEANIKTMNYRKALAALETATAQAQAKRTELREQVQADLDQAGLMFDEMSWDDLRQYVFAQHTERYVQALATRLSLKASQVRSPQALAKETALAAELNVVLEELQALQTEQATDTAQMAQLAPAVQQLVTADLSAREPALALVGPTGAGATQDELTTAVKQHFNSALTQFQAGGYNQAKLIELLNEAERLMGILAKRYGKDEDVLALQANLTEQKALLIQNMQLNTFSARNPGFRQALERILDQVAESETGIAISDFITYAVDGSQVVSRGGVPHATYSNPNAENIRTASYAGYMRVAVINGQTVLCVDNGSSHFNRPGFRGAEKQFIAAIRGIKQALPALGIDKMVFMSGHDLEGMTSFDQSKIVGILDLTAPTVRASKDIAANVEIEDYAALEKRDQTMQKENAVPYITFIQNRTAEIIEVLGNYVTDARVLATVENTLRGLSDETFELRTASQIQGALAVNRNLGGLIQVAIERQLEGELRNSTIVHDTVEAALAAQGIPEAHALSFIVEQALFPESIRAKLSNPAHYDIRHLRNIIANTPAVIQEIDEQTGVEDALKTRQKDNALVVARAAREILQTRQQARSLALDRRGFYGEETQAALTNIFMLFLRSERELRKALFAQAAVGNTRQLAEQVVQRGFDLLNQEQLDAFFKFFGHDIEERASTYTRKMLSDEIRRVAKTLKGTMYEDTLLRARQSLENLENGASLNVTIGGQLRQVNKLRIRKITATEDLSEEAMKAGAFFTVEDTPTGTVGYFNVMAHKDMPQACLHELLETVLGENHETVADLETFAGYSLGRMPVIRSLFRELAWPRRVVSLVLSVIGTVGLGLGLWLAVVSGFATGTLAVLLAGFGVMLLGIATYFKKRFIITVDGSDATGKTEVGQVLSRYYGYTYVDAKLYYRAFAQIVLDEIAAGNWQADAFDWKTEAEERAFSTFATEVVNRLSQADVTMRFDRSARERRMRVFVNQETGLRKREITDSVLPGGEDLVSPGFLQLEEIASRLGQVPAVRQLVDDSIRNLAREENLVAVGQTMGSKLFDQDARIKFYVVNNSLRDRAERLLRRPLRTEEELAAGLAEIEKMELAARTRSKDPLRPITDAEVLDTRNFTLADVMHRAQERVYQQSSVVRRFIRQIRAQLTERNRMLDRSKGEEVRREVLERVGDVWQAFSDIDGLSSYNMIYGKALTNFILDDVLDVVEQTANSAAVKKVVDRRRRQYRREIWRAALRLRFGRVAQLLPKLAVSRVITIRHGGDEGIYLMPDFLTPKEVHRVLRLIRGRVQQSMHRQYKTFEVKGLEGQEGALRTLAENINREYKDPKLVRVAQDPIFGTRLMLRTSRYDLGSRFRRELRGFVNLTDDQVSGRLIEMVLKKRLEESGLPGVRIENLSLAEMAQDQVAQETLELPGFAYLQDGYILTPTLSIGATKASRVEGDYVERRANEELTRADYQIWSDNLYELSGDFLHVAKKNGKNQVVVDQLDKALEPKAEEEAGAGLLGEATDRRLNVSRLLFEDNLLLRVGGKPKHETLYPKHFSIDGLRRLVSERLAVLQGKRNFQTEIYIGRAPPDTGPDKVQVVVINPQNTFLIELEGQYFGTFVDKARDAMRTALAAEWAEEQDRALDEVLADPALDEAVAANIQQMVSGEENGETLYKFKFLNDFISYTAGDQMISLPHLTLDYGSLETLKNARRMNKAMPTFLKQVEREMNDPVHGNDAKVSLTAVYAQMPTATATKRGIGPLFADLQVAGLAKQGKITKFMANLQPQALQSRLTTATERVLQTFASPDAQTRMVEEVGNAMPLGFRSMQVGQAAIFTTFTLFGLLAVAYGITQIVLAGTLVVSGVGLITSGLLLVTGLVMAARRAQGREVQFAVDEATEPSTLRRLARKAVDFVRGNPMIIIAIGVGLYTLLNPQAGAETGYLAAMTIVGAPTAFGSNRNERAWKKVEEIVDRNPELEPVARALYDAVKDEVESVLYLHQFERLHRELRDLNGYQAEDLIPLLAEHPQYFTRSQEILVNYQRNYRFGNFAEVLKVRDHILGMFQDGQLQAKRLIGLDVIPAALGQPIEETPAPAVVIANAPTQFEFSRNQRAWNKLEQIVNRNPELAPVALSLYEAIKHEPQSALRTNEFLRLHRELRLLDGYQAADLIPLLTDQPLYFERIQEILVNHQRTTGFGNFAEVLKVRDHIASLFTDGVLQVKRLIRKEVIPAALGEPIVAVVSAEQDSGEVLASKKLANAPTQFESNRQSRAWQKVEQLVAGHPELEPVARALYDAIKDQPENALHANQFGRLHRELRNLEGYQAADLVPLLADQPLYFERIQEILVNHQRTTGFGNFAEVLKVRDHIASLFTDGVLQVKRLISKEVIPAALGEPTVAAVSAEQDSGEVLASKKLANAPTQFESNRQSRAWQKVEQLVAGHPELAPVARALYDAIKDQPENALHANQFGRLHRELRNLEGYQAADLVPLLADQPLYFERIQEILVNHQRTTGFGSFAEVLKVRDHIASLFTVGALQVKRLIGKDVIPAALGIAGTPEQFGSERYAKTWEKVEQLVARNPELETVARALYNAIKDRPESLKYANKFESMHRALRDLEGYRAENAIQIILDRPRYFVHLEQLLVAYQRNFGFDDYADAANVLENVYAMIDQIGHKNAPRLLNLLSSRKQLGVIHHQGIGIVSETVDQMGIGALSQLQRQVKASEHEEYYLAYESLQVAKYLERIIDASTKPILICENVSYGQFVTQPLVARIEAYAAEKGKKVQFVKSWARSGMSHTSPAYIAENLFFPADAEGARLSDTPDITADVVRQLMTEAPHVVVLDGSKNQRYPDGFQQFSNLAALLNLQLNPGLTQDQVRALSKKSDEAHVLEVIKGQRELRRQLRQYRETGEDVVYDVQYWNPDGRMLPSRRMKETDVYQQNYEALQETPGQRQMILISGTMLDTSLPAWMNDQMGEVFGQKRRKGHRPGYFEDFYEFLNARFISRIRNYFAQLGERPAAEPAGPDQMQIAPIKSEVGLNGVQMYTIFHGALAALLANQPGAPVEQDPRDGHWRLLKSTKLKSLIPAIGKQAWAERLAKPFQAVFADWTGTLEVQDFAQALREGKRVGVATGLMLANRGIQQLERELRDLGCTDAQLANFVIYTDNGSAKWEFQKGKLREDTGYRITMSQDDIGILERVLAAYPDRRPGVSGSHYSVKFRTRAKAFEAAQALTGQFPIIKRQYSILIEDKEMKVYPREVTKQRAARDMAARLGADLSDLLILGDSAGSIFDNDTALVTEYGFNVGSIRAGLWGLAPRVFGNTEARNAQAAREVLAQANVLPAQPLPSERAVPLADSPLDGTPLEIREFLLKSWDWRGSSEPFMRDLMEALSTLGTPWRSPRVERMTRALIIAYIAKKYPSSLQKPINQILESLGLNPAERAILTNMAEESAFMALAGTYVSARHEATSPENLWNHLFEDRGRPGRVTVAERPAGPDDQGGAPQVTGRRGERGAMALPVVLGLGGVTILAIGLSHFFLTAVFTGASFLTVFSGTAVALGVVLIAVTGGMLAWQGRDQLATKARKETLVRSLRHHLRRALDFVRGNPMLIIGLIGFGLLSILQQPASSEVLMAGGLFGMVGISRNTIIDAEGKKIPQPNTGRSRVDRMLSKREEISLAVAEIDSFQDMKVIYGEGIADFIREKTLRIVQRYFSNREYLFRLDDRRARFAFAANNYDDNRMLNEMHSAQNYLFNSYNRRYRVVTLQYFDLDDQAEPLSDRDFEIRLSQLRNAVQEYGYGAVGVTEGRRVHIVYEIAAQSDLQHALEVINILKPTGMPADTLAAMPFEVEATVGLRTGYLLVPKLAVGLAGKDVYQQALAQVPTRKEEYRSKLPGNAMLRDIENAATAALLEVALPAGGEVVLAEELHAKVEESEFPAPVDLTPEMAIFAYNQRNDQIFQRWFVATARRIAAESQDKLEAIDALRQLYDANQEVVEEVEFDYLGVIWLNARQIIEDMRQMVHYALDVAELKFHDLTMLWERRRGEDMQNQYFSRNPEQKPALEVLSKAIKPRSRAKDMDKLRGILRSFVDDSGLDIMLAPGRVKEPFSILMNFVRYWNKAFRAKPDFADMRIYTERSIKVIVDDVVGIMLVIPDLEDMEEAVNALIPYLELNGYRIKPRNGLPTYGINMSVSRGQDGQIRVEPVAEGYYDLKLKIAPTGPMPFGAEIKILPDFIEESATRPGYTLIKQDVLSDVNWTIAIGGPSGTNKIAVARKLADNLKYDVVDVGLIYRGVQFAFQQMKAEGVADTLANFMDRGEFTITDSSLTALYGRRGKPKETRTFNREQVTEGTIDLQLSATQQKNLDKLVTRLVRIKARGGRIVVVGQTPEQYVKKADVRIYFGLTTAERSRQQMDVKGELPAPKDALIISPETQKEVSRTVRLVEQMIADKIMDEGMARSTSARRLTGRYQALSLRNTLLVAAAWTGIMALGLGIPFLPALGVSLLYPSAKLVTSGRLLAAKYGVLGMFTHWGEPVGVYDPVSNKMLDPRTGEALSEAPWAIAAHEAYSHPIANRALKAVGVDLTALSPGSWSWRVANALAEFLTHTLDFLTAPVALARAQSGPRMMAMVTSGVFVVSGLLLMASFAVAWPLAVPVALAVIMAGTGTVMSLLRVRVATPEAATAAAAVPAVAEEVAAPVATTGIQGVVSALRNQQALGVEAQPGATGLSQFMIRLRASGLGRGLQRLWGLPTSLKLMMQIPAPRLVGPAKYLITGLAIAAWIGASWALVSVAGMEVASSGALAGVAIAAPGQFMDFRLRANVTHAAGREVINSTWMANRVAELDQNQSPAAQAAVIQGLLTILANVQDNTQAREGVLEVLSQVPGIDMRTVTLQTREGDRLTRTLPAVIFEQRGLVLRLMRSFPGILIDNQPFEVPQPRFRRAIGSSA